MLARPATIHAEERRDKERAQCMQRARKGGLRRGRGERMEVEVSFLKQSGLLALVSWVWLTSWLTTSLNFD